ARSTLGNMTLTQTDPEPVPAHPTTVLVIGVTRRGASHDWKRRGERLVRASGNAYTIMRPGWFDYNDADQLRITLLQGDTRHAAGPDDLDPLFANLDPDAPDGIDGVRDQANLPLAEEPQRVRDALPIS
ncbi:MAG: hypothetical protein JWR01_1061, partial [Subtercola sp.]|nr:hypothetical protein [Subtercola sp.]